jgi:ribosomal protein L4
MESNEPKKNKKSKNKNLSRLRLKKLTEEQKEFFKSVYKNKKLSWKDRMRILEDYTGISERNVRKWAIKMGLKEREEDAGLAKSPEYEMAKERSFDKTKKRFIITWAQNDTPVHERFFQNIKSYAEFIDADVHVIAGRYKNPTSVFTDKKHDRWHWPVVSFLDAARHNVHKYVSIMSDIKIQPTAVNPMSGLKSVSGTNSCIFGHPKVQQEMIPVLEDCKPKIMLTTGACTVKNYTDSKAGKKGEFHHTLGFVVVEIADDDNFYVRQVTADDNGDFTDLYYDVKFNGKQEVVDFSKEDQPALSKLFWMERNFVKEGDMSKPALEWRGTTEISRIKRLEAIVLGDIHFGHHDEQVLNKTHEFMGQVDPKHVVLHDVFDGDSISHHQIKDAFVNYAKEVHDKNNLKKEVKEMLEGLKPFEKYKNVVVVRSNHDDFLDRWLKNEDWKKQPTAKNSVEYMKYSQVLLEQYARGFEYVKGVIPHIINEEYPEFICLSRNDSYKVKGWELGQHGDIGSGGSRGSLQQFRNLDTKIVVGHYHSPGRKDGALAVGTSTKLRLGYNNGPSAWLQSHVIIHKNGKAQHINFIDGEFTTFKDDLEKGKTLVFGEPNTNMLNYKPL